MASNKSQKVQTRFGAGEGVPAPLRLTNTSDIQGVTTVEYEINMGLLPAPSLKFVCDGMDLVVAGNTLQLLFFQKNVFSGSPRALLVVHISKRAMAAFAQTMTFGTKKHFPFERYSPGIEPEATRAMEATYLRANGTNGSAVMDFYYCSPIVRSMISSDATEVPVEPVVRIQPRPEIYQGFCRYAVNNLMGFEDAEF